VRLTVREAAVHLGVDEPTARRWVAQRGLPVHHVQERMYINPIELWEWAVEQGIAVSRRLLEEERGTPDDVPSLSDLLHAGGIFRDVVGSNKAEVLRAFVDRLPLPPEQDRDFLFSVLDAREAMGSTGIGDGIAIPHVRNAIVLRVDQPFVTLGLLERPIDFGAVDGKPVHAIFMVVSPTVPAHLKVLSRLAFALRDDDLRAMLARRATSAEILERIAFVEATRTTGSHRAVRP